MSWRLRADVAAAGARERLRVRGGDARSGGRAVLWAWAMFVIAGMIVAKTSEHWQSALPHGGHPVASVAFAACPTEWAPAADASLLSEGRLQRVVVDDTPVLLVRQGENIFAIHDRCSHRGCSLSEGSLKGQEIVCSCHGSRFSLRDGAVKAGPATSPQPAFQVRVENGRVEVRLLG